MNMHGWLFYLQVQSAYLRNEILLNSLQLGLPPAIFCHNSLFIELMCQISILIEVQGTRNTETMHYYVLDYT